jgi:predicted metal-dependent HD superfamily phosphohydrolase
MIHSTDTEEPLWECPSCRTRITNTQLQQARINYHCAGVFGSGERRTRCNFQWGDYKQVETNT